MYHGHQVVVLVTGRGSERYLRLCLSHVLKARPFVDECQLWLETVNPLDLEYVQSVVAMAPAFFKRCDLLGSVVGGTPGTLFERASSDGTLYIKLDDAIVWMAEDCLERLAAWKVKNPGRFLGFAQVANNQIVDHLRQRASLIDSEPFIEWCAWGTAWNSGEICEKILTRMCYDIVRGDLERHYQAYSEWELRSDEPVATNAVIWAGTDMAGLSRALPLHGHERFFAHEATLILGKKNSLVGSTLAAHFAFEPQRQYMNRSAVLKTFSELALVAKPLRQIYSPSFDLLFLHHLDDPITQRNYQSFLQYAPVNCRVIAVHIEGQSHMKGSLPLSLEGLPRNDHPTVCGLWSEVDLVSLAYERLQETNASHIIQVEWDVLCRWSMHLLLDVCAGFDVVANCLSRQLGGYWGGVHAAFKGTDWMRDKQQTIPLAFLSASVEALKLMRKEILQNEEWHNTYCEVRWPSVVARLGLEAHYVEADRDSFWWNGPGMIKDQWFPLTHPNKT